MKMKLFEGGHLTQLHFVLILSALFLAFGCNMGHMGPGVSMRDICKDGDGFLEEGARSQRDQYCSMYLALRSPDGSAESSFSNSMLSLCIYYQVKLTECNDESRFPRYLVF
ncbi:MAG: hypothetical protein CMF59_04050 [Leptospiraceae bacterium]|nr:hypothetical protein [Leptospiraceae bacterium]